MFHINLGHLLLQFASEAYKYSCAWGDGKKGPEKKGPRIKGSGK